MFQTLDEVAKMVLWKLLCLNWWGCFIPGGVWHWVL